MQIEMKIVIILPKYMTVQKCWWTEPSTRICL